MADVERQWIGISLDHMAFLEEQIAELDQSLAEQIRTAGVEREEQLLQTVPGVKQDAACLSPPQAEVCHSECLK